MSPDSHIFPYTEKYEIHYVETSSFSLISSNRLMFNYLVFFLFAVCLLQKLLYTLAPRLSLQTHPSELSDRLYSRLKSSVIP